ncbi:hypothetical protein [Streptomyces sp. NBC_01433]|uniref:hypothetical protein n=1 Tax=Streptomyces sp. NBC_01433 TaxID=2903864 RepID=UPI002B1CCBB0|nr:hypothetical protein [Streptomyces sp. NBC_01433]
MRPGFLTVRLALTLGAAGILLRRYLPRIIRALAPQPPTPQPLFAELQRIETDPAYRALFLAGLDAAIARHDAERTARLHAVEAAADLLQRLVRPAPGPRHGEPATATGAGTDYVAEITVTTGTRRPVSLGRITAPNRRLALRWLRRQALRLADGHGHLISPDTTPWTRAGNDVRPVTFHGSDAPESLRAWAADDQRQADALHQMESGPGTLLTVTDPAVGLHLTLTGRTARHPRPHRTSPYQRPFPLPVPRHGAIPVENNPETRIQDCPHCNLCTGTKPGCPYAKPTPPTTAPHTHGTHPAAQ